MNWQETVRGKVSGKTQQTEIPASHALRSAKPGGRVRESTWQTNRIEICFWTLDLRIGVRIPASQPFIRKHLPNPSDSNRDNCSGSH